MVCAANEELMRECGAEEGKLFSFSDVDLPGPPQVGCPSGELRSAKRGRLWISTGEWRMDGFLIWTEKGQGRPEKADFPQKVTEEAKKLGNSPRRSPDNCE